MTTARKGEDRGTTVPPDARVRLGQVADAMIESGAGLPSGVQAGVHTDLLDQVVKTRPDLVAPLLRALDELGPDPGLAAVERLAERRLELYEALALVVAGGYLMSSRVTAPLKYRFAEIKIVDPRDIAVVVEEGLLDAVAERTPFYRLPPDAPPEHRP
ncbi:hypothetical protein [Actinomadura sp. 7K534]|uniref:hypothetical protein n=1 Tax=Actinomadura sp. 7K534 TaxID=2530366 RepID=UPI0010540E31|nr:hypothetical protein [Actinomadura sp. 7K534]TDB97950.1 hypothetical protein E1266_05025 [Actinomadura sp. 7K534]